MAPFSGKERALSFFERLRSFLNDLWSRHHTIVPNHCLYNPVSVLDVLNLLPLNNCRQCGYSTCMAFAAALRQKKAVPDQCPDFCPPIQQQAIYPIYDRNGHLRSTVSIEINSAHGSKNVKLSEVDTEGSFSASPLATVVKAPPVKSSTPDVQYKLTAREIEVLRLLAEGATNNAISEILAISPHTVKSHVVHIFNKLGVNDRTQAAVWATRHQLL